MAASVGGAAFRTKPLIVAKTCSIGLRSGEYLGRNRRRAPAALTAFRTAFPLWEPRLSRMTMSLGLRVGTRTGKPRKTAVPPEVAASLRYAISQRLRKRIEESFG